MSSLKLKSGTQEIIKRCCAGMIMMKDSNGRLLGVRCYHTIVEDDGSLTNGYCDCIEDKTNIISFYNLSKRAQKLQIQYNMQDLEEQLRLMKGIMDLKNPFGLLGDRKPNWTIIT
jgi:hypothetical protein